MGYSARRNEKIFMNVVIDDLLKTLKDINSNKQCLEKIKGIIQDTTPFENKILYYTEILKANCSHYRFDIEHIKNNKLDFISQITYKRLHEFKSASYGLQGIHEDYPDDDIKYYQETSRYWNSKMNYYKSLGTDTLEKINFILNIEEILKEYVCSEN